MKLIQLPPSIAGKKEHVDDHPRFAQVRAYMAGNHPEVQVGQIWQNVDPAFGDDNGLTQARVIKINANTGIAEMIVVNSDGHGSITSLGATFTIPSHSLTFDGNGNGWNLIGFTVSLDANGRVKEGYNFPPATVEPIAHVYQKEEKPRKPNPRYKPTTRTIPPRTRPQVESIAPKEESGNPSDKNAGEQVISSASAPAMTSASGTSAATLAPEKTDEPTKGKGLVVSHSRVFH